MHGQKDIPVHWVTTQLPAVTGRESEVIRVPVSLLRPPGATLRAIWVF
jgi:hypothetical protein